MSVPFSMSASGVGGGRDLRIPPTDPTRSPDFVRLTNRGNAPPQTYNYALGYQTTFIVLEGKKVATDIGASSDADAWDFTLNVNYLHHQDKTGTEPYISFAWPRVTHEIAKGTEKAVLLYRTDGRENEDPLEEAARRQEQQKNINEAIRRVARLPKDDALRQMETERTPFPQTAYIADFTITGNGYLSDQTHDGKIRDFWGAETMSEHDDGQFVGTLIYKVSLTIDDMDYARAVITFTDSNGYPRQWTLEGYMGVAQPQKPPQRPKPPEKPDIDYDDPFAPMRPKDPPEIDPNDPFAPMDAHNRGG